MSEKSTFVKEKEIDDNLFYYLLGTKAKLTLNRVRRLINIHKLDKNKLLTNTLQNCINEIHVKNDHDNKDIIKKLSALKSKGTKLEDFIPDVEREMNELSKEGINIVNYFSKSYPIKLKKLMKVKNTPYPPLLLYYKGDFSNVNFRKTIAVIGPRKPSSYAKESTKIISEELADNGYTVVSGLANGIDRIAHRSSLGRKGSTIAILGTGLNKIYPRENIDLATEISKKGVLFSEFDINQDSKYWTFAKRNRIIAGISLATVLIEGSEKSGTAYASEITKALGRPLFCLQPIDEDSQLAYQPKYYLKNYKKAYEITSDNAFKTIEKVLKQNRQYSDRIKR